MTGTLRRARPVFRLTMALALAASLLDACGSSSSTRSAQPRPGTAGSTPRSATRGRTSTTPRRFPHMVLPAKPLPRTVRVPILTYHRVHVFATELTKSVPDLTVEPSVFRAEIAALARGGYHTITQHQLYEALFRGRPLPSKPVMITVDDGYVDDVTQILPTLRAHHLLATFYIITGRMHEQGFLNPTQVRQLEAAGMDIGAHTRTHASLPGLTLSARLSEIDGSRRDLERLLGHPVYAFAYPYGAENASVVDEVRRAGFSLAVTTQGGTHESSLASLTMPRIHVGRSATAATVLAAAGG